MANIFQYGVKAAERLATATRSGMLQAADFVKLKALATINSVTAPLALAAGALSIPAAAGPATNGYMLGADKAKLDASTTAFNASTLVQRDANGFVPRGTDQAASFATNWSNFGAPWSNVEYTIDLHKRVHLRGMCKKSVAVAGPDTIFTLAAGYRPAADEYFDVNSNGAFGTVFVTSAGLVRVQVGNAAYVSLSGISFYAA